MATSRQPWSVPGVILFSHGDLSYEVDLSRPLVEEWAQSRLGERIVRAWERMTAKRLRPVIVRSLPPASSGDPEALARMRARLTEEARLATHLQHAKIARIIACHEVAGVLYVVSEPVEGTSINTLISYSQMREAFLSPAFSLYVGAEVASALHYAHTCKAESGAPLGIVHRDINPARIHLGPKGGVMLTDFARARSLLPGRVATTLPRPQGDVFYCSPEALLGKEEDPRSDLFSLGLVLLELATWRHLYSMADVRPRDLKKALTPEVKKQVLDAAYTAMEADLPDHAEDCIVRAATFTPQDVDEITAPLAHPLRPIIRRLIQRNPDDRYPSAAALARGSAGRSHFTRCPLWNHRGIRGSVWLPDGGQHESARCGPTSEAQLPLVVVTEEDIITGRGGVK
jgi:serine/threonine protein kinase